MKNNNESFEIYKMNKNNYSKLVELSKRNALWRSISYLLEWDQETYMPADGSPLRAEQIELLASVAHKDKTSKQWAKLLSEFIDLKTGQYIHSTLDENQKANLREWRRDYLQATCLPNAFVKKFAKVSSESMTVWAEARKHNDFAKFAPFLSQIIDLSRQKAEFLGYKEHPYDALLDLYEPGMTTSQISLLFNTLGEKIVHLLHQIQKSPQVDDHFLHGNFAKEKQLEFGHILLKAVGYDEKKGRLDISTHPFSMSLYPDDSRITTRIHPTSLMDCASAVLHEAGHSLYEMGLPIEHFGTPLCESISLGIHESQSRFWETRIGQSKPFWMHFYPILQSIFPEKLQSISIDSFYKAINKVQPGCIRIEADEVTYSLHVILRFEMEKELIEGSLQVKDIPEAWNSKMQKYLGILPKNNTEGCLQDIHWSMGGFGYFPTYTLGNIFAAQIFDIFAKDNPSWETQVAKGELKFIKEWLNQHIHKYGKFYSAQDLIRKISNKDFSIDPFINYLTAKYKKIYP